MWTGAIAWGGGGKGRKEGRDSMLCMGTYRVGLVASVVPELSDPEFVGNRITKFMGKTL